jgi:8-hydroxy-5-deazaflavin:NADPH oxidoreductase
MDAETVAIIGGTGDQGMGLALRWAKAGRHVVIGSRVKERAMAAAEKVQSLIGADAHAGESHVEGLENTEAVARAPLVVLTVPFEAHATTLAALKERFRPGQTLVDCTVPLESAVGGSPSRLLGVWAGSAAEQAARQVPADVAVVAAFHNASANTLQNLSEPIECDVIVCGDDGAARRSLAPWVEAIPNCRYVDGGRLENARIVESLTALLVGINRRYKVRSAGIRLTGVPL